MNKLLLNNNNNNNETRKVVFCTHAKSLSVSGEFSLQHHSPNPVTLLPTWGYHPSSPISGPTQRPMLLTALAWANPKVAQSLRALTSSTKFPLQLYGGEKLPLI